MKRFKLLYIIIISILFISKPSPAQTGEVTISGFVTDSTSGEALIGCNILLYKDSITVNKPPFRGAATNSYGFYALPNVPRGTYILISRSIGYKTLIRKIDIKIQSGTVRYNFEMQQKNIKLQEVLVKGEKKHETTISTIDVSTELLKQLPSLSGEVDLFKVLEMLPGVKVASELSNGLYVRGGSPDQNLTLVDGVIDYNPSHLGNFASTFNSDAIQNIRLIKGAFPAEYGSRLSSVLDIKLRSGTKEKEKGKVGIGLISSHLMLDGPIGSKVTYMFAARKMYYDLLQKNFIKNSVVPRYNFYDLNGKMTITSSESNIYTLSAMYSRDNLYNPSNNLGTSYNINWSNMMADVKWLYINSESLFLTTSLSYVDYEFESNLQDNSSSQTATDYYALSKLRDVYVRTNAEVHWTKNNTLKAGYELALHDYFLIYSNFYDPLLLPTLNSMPDIIATEAAVYAENEGQIGNWLKSNIGIRGYYFNSKKYFDLEPRVSLKFLASDNLSFNAAYAVAHQFLHLVIRNDITLPTDLWYPSNDKVEPSKATQYVFGVDYNLFNRQYVFSVEGYYKSMKNLYEFKNAPKYQIGEPISDLFTKGEGEAYGIEFFANKTMGDLTGWIGYTLSWTKRKFPDLNGGKVFYPRYDRRNDISIVLGYKFGNNWSAGLTWTYATGQGYTLPNGQYQFQSIGENNQNRIQFNYTSRNAYRLPPYHKLDLSVSYKFKWGDKSFETYLSLFNVYNRQNPFAFYTTYANENAGGNNQVNYSEPKINQLSLFPFIPSIGINMEF